MYEEFAAINEANVTVGLDGSHREAQMNNGITPAFFIHPTQNMVKTAEAGRPVFDEQECVRIFVAGDQYNQVVHPVDDAIKNRFPEQYRRWKEKKEAISVGGTPIRQWALLQPSQIAEFEALKIFNVEGLANLPESALMKGQGMREWKTKAAAWLESAKDGALSVKLAADNQRMSDMVAAQQKQIEDLMTKISDLSAEVASSAVKAHQAQHKKG